MQNLGIGLTLMLVGMVTVFVILLIVIYGSKLLVSAVNRIAPEEQRPVKSSQGTTAAVPGDVKAVLEAAVSQITGGKGHVVKITKI